MQLNALLRHLVTGFDHGYSGLSNRVCSLSISLAGLSMRHQYQSHRHLRQCEYLASRCWIASLEYTGEGSSSCAPLFQASSLEHQWHCCTWFIHINGDIHHSILGTTYPVTGGLLREHVREQRDKFERLRWLVFQKRFLEECFVTDHAYQYSNWDDGYEWQTSGIGILSSTDPTSPELHHVTSSPAGLIKWPRLR